MTGVRALTLWQPWATMIARGLKRCELRTWAPPPSILDGRLLIHAAKRPIEWPSSRFRHEVLKRLRCDDAAFPRGAIVAECAVEDVLVVAKPPRRAGGPCLARDAYTGETTWCGTDPWGVWEPGTVVWRLCEVGPVPPAPCAGRQGLWRPSAETLERIGGELAAWTEAP